MKALKKLCCTLLASSCEGLTIHLDPPLGRVLAILCHVEGL